MSRWFDELGKNGDGETKAGTVEDLLPGCGFYVGKVKPSKSNGCSVSYIVEIVK